MQVHTKVKVVLRLKVYLKIIFSSLNQKAYPCPESRFPARPGPRACGDIVNRQLIIVNRQGTPLAYSGQFTFLLTWLFGVATVGLG